MKAQTLTAADGMSGDDARPAARRRYGNSLRLREQSREPWTFGPVETWTLWTWAPASYEALRPRVTTLDHPAAYTATDAQSPDAESRCSCARST